MFSPLGSTIEVISFSVLFSMSISVPLYIRSWFTISLSSAVSHTSISEPKAPTESALENEAREFCAELGAVQ